MYTEMTSGTLILHQITPVIRCLFGVYELDENVGVGQEVHFYDSEERGLVQWHDITRSMLERVSTSGLDVLQVSSASEKRRSVLVQTACSECWTAISLRSLLNFGGSVYIVNLSLQLILIGTEGIRVPLFFGHFDRS